MKFIKHLLLFITIIACTKTNVKVITGVKHVSNPKTKISNFDYNLDIKIKGETKDYIIASVAKIIEDKQGNIYILDREDGNVKVFDYNGNYIKTFAKKGKGPGELNTPDFIVFLKNGNILISDAGNGRFNIYNSRGEFIKSHKSKITGNVIQNNDGSFYVISNGFNVSIEKRGVFEKLDKNFKHIKSIGTQINKKSPHENLLYNMAFFCKSKNKIVVNYMIENKLKVFEDEKLTMQITRDLYAKGKADMDVKDNHIGIVIQPLTSCIESDSKGNVYSITRCTNKQNCSVLLEKFDSNGVLVKTYGIKQKIAPTLYIGKNDKFYFADEDFTYIKRFKQN